MGYLPKGTIGGGHEVVGNPEDADIRVGLEFSHRKSRFPVGYPNLQIAGRIWRDQYEIELPIIASQSVADGLQSLFTDVTVTEVFDGPSAKGIQENTGTYGELVQLRDYMRANNYRTAALYSSAFNIGNIIRQARLIELDFVVPPDMPKGFDWKSDQLWTKNLPFWVVLSYPRIRALRKREH